MKNYTKEIFIGLDFSRQVKISLDLIYEIEKNWVVSLDYQSNKVLELVHILREKLLWLNINPISVELRINHIIDSLGDELRPILNLATALERWLSLSLKDDSILVSKIDKLESNKNLQTFPIYVVLDNLRSAFNVGSIFRTCECLGVKHIYLVGYTPTPNDSPVQKTAMGTEALVSWSFKERVSDVIKDLKEKNVSMIAMETTNESTNIYDAKIKQEAALFFGNERFGLEPEVLKEMDQIIEIPMMGLKNSLNVSNALAISASEIIRSWKSV